ncbi:MAG: hypothetical protein PHS17_04480, partial [Desulfobacterales bacterium]|nr:hypothetical protein [Desulfobacterales bacterium]
MNESVIGRYIDPSGSHRPLPVPVRRVDLARSLLTPEQNQGCRTRIALLIKSMKRSGGNRVIVDLFDRLCKFRHTEVHVFVVPDRPPHIGEVQNLILARRRYRAAASVTRTRRAVNPGEFDLLISTSRRTLDFVTDLAHPAHVHLLQAIEAWDSVNSTP